MSLLNYHEVEQQLLVAGLVLKDSLQVGTVKPVRCRVEGHDKERRGWYRLYEMPLDSGDSLLVGSYGIWQGNDNGATKIELPKLGRERLTPAQAEALKARMLADRKAAAAELAVQHERAAARAYRCWGLCLREAGDNAYLHRKGLPPGQLYGARLTGKGNLVIPLADARAKVWGLQVIYGDPAVKAKKGRDKDYWPTGLKKQGHFHLIGMAGRGGVILLAEGFATGATLHEATGLPVAVAFDAGNLLPVAKTLAAQFKGAKILVCADDDWLQKCRACGQLTPVDAGTACAHCGQPHGTENPGVSAASAAAMAVGGAWVRPTFPAQRPADRKGDTDFNDLHVHPQGGLALVSAQISDALVQQGWKVNTARAATPPAPQGGGEGDGAGRGRRQAVSVMNLDDLVERFIPLDDGTGEFIFDTWTNKIARIGQAVRLLAKGVRWDDVKAHPQWIRRGAYYMDQVGFDPSGGDHNVKLNTWQGWPIEPGPEGQGDKGCKKLLDLLRYLCGEDNGDEVYWWMLRWLAYPLQHPGAKMASAIIMHGPQGTGKSTFFQTYSKIFGDYATVLNQRGLEDKFNSDWTDSKLFLLAEEVVTRQEMWHIKNELKELVTGEWVRVNTKQVAAYRQRNQINLIFLSNEGMPLPLDNDDRRHLVVWTPPQREPAYYDAVNAEIDAGGIAALYRYLLELDLGDFHPKKRPPNTHAKAELIQVSKTSELRFIDEWIGLELPLPLGPCVAMDLYNAYQTWCRRNGEKFPRASNQFLNCVGRLIGWDKARKRIRYTTNDVQFEQQLSIVIPSAEALQRSKATRGDAETEPDWLGRWCRKFDSDADEYAKEETWQGRRGAA